MNTRKIKEAISHMYEDFIDDDGIWLPDSKSAESMLRLVAMYDGLRKPKELGLTKDKFTATWEDVTAHVVLHGIDFDLVEAVYVRFPRSVGKLLIPIVDLESIAKFYGIHGVMFK